MKQAVMNKFSLKTLLNITLATLLISACTSRNGDIEDDREFEETFGINGLKIGDSVIANGFCCANDPDVTGFHLTILLEDQKGIIVDINSKKVKVRCRDQRFQVGVYNLVRFTEVCDSLGFDSGRFVMIGDSVTVEDELWDEKIIAFRKVVGETDSIYDLKYKEGQNFIEIPDIVVQSHPDWWRKLE